VPAEENANKSGNSENND